MAYLIGLGLWTLFSGHADADTTFKSDVRLRRVFPQGVLVNAFNPKVALFFLALLPQFVDPDAARPALQIGLLGLVLVAIALLLDLGWALAAGAAGGLLRRSGRFLRAQRYVSGGVYVALGVATAFADRSKD